MVKDLVLQILDFAKVCIGDDGTIEFDQLAMVWRLIQDVAAEGADVVGQRHHQTFADRINRWIGHLCKELAEIAEKALWLV